MMDKRDQQTKDEDMAELAEGAQAMTRAAVEELRELVPSSAHWARARALTEAREWTEYVTGVAPLHEWVMGSADGQRMIESLADRWASWIESGVFPAEGDR